MELVKVENGQIVIAQEVEDRLKAFQIEKARMDMLEKQIKEAMLKAMEDNGIKSYESDNVRITYKAPTTRSSVDTKALKEQGLYDSFVKTSPVKASVVVTWKD
jgi:hypothetical protein